MFRLVLNTSGFWTYLWFWIYQSSEYASFSECTRLLDIPGIWISLGFWMYQILSMPLVLNMKGFWIYRGSEFARVKQSSWYAWICLNNSWISLIMREYAWIYRSTHEYTYLMTFVVYFSFVIPCHFEGVVTYFNVYTKLQWWTKHLRQL